METKRTRLIPEIVKIEAKKKELDRSKTNRGGILKLLLSPGIDSKELIRQPM
jgi:hypothetical protein